jgi:hypothetical protein
MSCGMVFPAPGAAVVLSSFSLIYFLISLTYSNILYFPFQISFFNGF